MAVPDPTRLTTALSDLLAASVASLTAPPAFRIISAGAPAVRCPMLAVWASPMRISGLAQPTDIPSPRQEPRTRIVTMNVELWLARCTSSSPSEAQLNDDGETLARAGWELFTGLIYRQSQSTLFASFAEPQLPRAANITAAEIREPEGQYMGWNIAMDVNL